MIRIAGISVKEFRGIRDLSLELEGKNFAVCGRNGTGKSGVVDAIEFILTGSVSRLSGQGRGDLSLTAHGPHVDSRDAPQKAIVSIRAEIPSLGQTVTASRSAAKPKVLKLSPDSPEAREVFAQVESHPEVVLSRREIIKYVITTPGERQKEVQALLRLDEVDSVRKSLERIANSSRKEADQQKSRVAEAREGLARLAGISTFSTSEFITAANARRSILKLEPLPTIDGEVSVLDGLASGKEGTPTAKLTRGSAIADLDQVSQQVDVVKEAVGKDVPGIREVLEELRRDEAVLDDLKKVTFLKSGDAIIEGPYCPFCDKEWDPSELREHIRLKLERLKEAEERREKATRLLVPICQMLTRLAADLEAAVRICVLLDTKRDPGPLSALVARCRASVDTLNELVPLDESLGVLASLENVDKGIRGLLGELRSDVEAIPEASREDEAKTYLIRCQEGLGTLRTEGRKLKKASAIAEIAKKARDSFEKKSTEVLKGAYSAVQDEFARLYGLINQDDEKHFSARLVPEGGSLDLRVDFYGKGFFPPAAYHSEGHQDAMGLCLYLALMKHLLGEHFTLAVLDDVVMSVDAAHRKEVCRVLKAEFPNVQFVVTTHDRVWLAHMKSSGLIAAKADVHFRDWSVDVGPRVWEGASPFEEVRERLSTKGVDGAAGPLRRYMEYWGSLVCAAVGASVLYRPDSDHSLGELLPPALGRVKKLMKRAVLAATSWGHEDKALAIQERFGELLKEEEGDRWQLNAATHYNEWASLTENEFKPLVDTYEELVKLLTCGACNSTMYVTYDAGRREQSFRCACGGTDFSLVKNNVS